jgi:hypothetical protein
MTLAMTLENRVSLGIGGRTAWKASKRRQLKHYPELT